MHSDKINLYTSQIRSSGVAMTMIVSITRTMTSTMTMKYEGRTESHEQFFFFACELGTADEAECGGRWNQLLCYP